MEEGVKGVKRRFSGRGGGSKGSEEGFQEGEEGVKGVKIKNKLVKGREGVEKGLKRRERGGE